MISKLFKRALGLFGLATVSVAVPVAAQTQAQPALWEVSDPDTTIYLFGTIHLLPAGFSWQSPKVTSAIAQSDTLVVETIVDSKNPQALAAELVKLGYSPGLPPLAMRVAPDKRPMLQAAIAKSGIPPHIFDQMESWAAAFTLLGVQFKELGLQGQHGVEETLRTAFAAAGKPVGQLESNAEQLGFFDKLSPAAQRELLEGSIEAPEAMSGMFSEMLRAWGAGDVDAIARSFNQDLAGSPELMDALLKRRNQNWTRWIEQRLAQPGTVLVAVGAGHLAGANSVQAMLQRGGYKVRRLQ